MEDGFLACGEQSQDGQREGVDCGEGAGCEGEGVRGVLGGYVVGLGRRVLVGCDVGVGRTGGFAYKAGCDEGGEGEDEG